MSLIRIIATFILIYLIFRLFTSIVLPWLMRWYLNRFKKKFYEQNPHLRQDQEQTGKGKSKVRITYKRSQQGEKSLDDVGEYVDYEEIKEEEKKKNNKN
ncbi:MAG: hypothetical protein EA393_12335 [Bacteroidetes bacterium]|nr:MAG: hypothetical protein EA393_12335 [Bacteroidota bacterium]